MNWQNKISPDHKIVPLLFVADYRISPVDKIVKDDEEPVKLCNYTDVYKNTYITSDIEFMEGSASENEIERFLIKDGDVLITKDSESWNDIGIPAIVKGDFEHTTVCGYHLALMRPYKNLVIPKFLFYCFESKQHRLQLEIEATGVTRFGIPKNAIAKYKIPLPLLTQQSKIVDYLDNEVAKIDALIEKKTQLITILEEKKKAVINQVVTKGLDLNVSLKYSGIEWLGEIPEHWEVMKVKHVLKSLNSIRVPLSSEERGLMTDREYDYYGASGVIDKVEDYLFDEPLLLIGEDGANLVTRSSRLAFIAKGKYWVNNHAHILKPIFGILEYYCELLETYDYSLWVSGSAQPKLTSENLMNIPLIVPPIEEQKIIAEFLDKILFEHNKLSNRITDSIELLKEKRTAIISAAVNGELNASLS